MIAKAVDAVRKLCKSRDLNALGSESGPDGSVYFGGLYYGS